MPSASSFLSTPSGWRATKQCITDQNTIYISIHALRVEGDREYRYEDFDKIISIHALRVEGDYTKSKSSKRQSDFYPRPPGGGRRFQQCLYFCLGGFLSTPSGWRATPDLYIMQRGGWISIHALRVEGDINSAPPKGRHSEISIHALRVEGDDARPKSVTGKKYFYPRPPGGGRRSNNAVYVG